MVGQAAEWRLNPKKDSEREISGESHRSQTKRSHQSRMRARSSGVLNVVTRPASIADGGAMCGICFNTEAQLLSCGGTLGNDRADEAGDPASCLGESKGFAATAPGNGTSAI